jgi:hypothetical protein
MVDKLPLLPPGYIMPLTIFFSTAAAACTRSSHGTGVTKRTVKIDRLVMILQFSCSPVFELIAVSGANVRSVISQLTDRFLSRRFRFPLNFNTKE